MQSSDQTSASASATRGIFTGQPADYLCSRSGARRERERPLLLLLATRRSPSSSGAAREPNLFFVFWAQRPSRLGRMREIAARALSQADLMRLARDVMLGCRCVVGGRAVGGDKDEQKPPRVWRPESTTSVMAWRNK